MASSILLIFSVIAIAAVGGNAEIKYNVTNNVPGSPGGKRFDAEIGVDFSLKTLKDATPFILKTFKMKESDRPEIESITLIIEPAKNIAVVSDHQIHFDDGYIAKYTATDPDLRTDFAGLLYHEMTLVWQWNGQGKTPIGLVTGIADWMSLKAGYISQYWPKPGDGETWDQGYGHTARFLEYCESIREGFVADLNAEMKTIFSTDMFRGLLGKPLDQLWKEYKAIAAVREIKYNVTNNVPGSPGGKRFDAEIGVDFSLKTLKDATPFILKIFKMKESDRPEIESISLFIEPAETIAVAYDHQIHFDDAYIAKYTLTDPDLRADFAGILHHEMTHLWQWNGKGKTPVGLVEGIADWMRLKAGYVSQYWPKPGDGETWDQGYGQTARFLEYCESVREGFVGDLNAKMKTTFSQDMFKELLGKPLDQLWKEYKAKYSN